MARYSAFEVIKNAFTGNKGWLGSGNIGRNTTIVRSFWHWLDRATKEVGYEIVREIK